VVGKTADTTFMLAVQIIMLPPLICGALSDESDICLSVAYIGPK